MTAGAVLRLKRGHDRPRVHPWIFKGDVADVSDVPPGTAVTVIDAAARFVGRGFYNPRPALCCRILTRRDEPIDGSFFRRRLHAARAFRANLVSAEAPAARAADGSTIIAAPTAGRLVWSEADFLPGLVVDRYGDALVVQCQTLGMARVRREVVAELRALLGDRPVLDADDDTPAALEGFAPARGWRDRAGPDHVIVDEGLVRLRASLVHRTQDRPLPRPGREPPARGHAGPRPRRARRVLVHGGLRLPRAGGRGAPRRLSGVGAGRRRRRPRQPRAERRGRPRRDPRRQRLRRAAAARSARASASGWSSWTRRPSPARGRPCEAAGRGYKEINLRAMRLLGAGRSPHDVLVLAPRLAVALRGDLSGRRGGRGGAAPGHRPARPGAGSSRPARRARDALSQRACCSSGRRRSDRRRRPTAR